MRADPLGLPFISIPGPSRALLAGLFFWLGEGGELARFVQNGGGVAAVGVVVLHQHRDHVGTEAVRLGGENVAEALLLIIAQDDNGLFVLLFGNELLDFRL